MKYTMIKAPPLLSLITFLLPAANGTIIRLPKLHLIAMGESCIISPRQINQKNFFDIKELYKLSQWSVIAYIARAHASGVDRIQILKAIIEFCNNRTAETADCSFGRILLMLYKKYWGKYPELFVGCKYIPVCYPKYPARELLRVYPSNVIQYINRKTQELGDEQAVVTLLVNHFGNDGNVPIIEAIYRIFGLKYPEIFAGRSTKSLPS